MKAVYAGKAGTPDVLELREIPKPEPRENEILVKVAAGSVTQGDVKLRAIPRWVLGPLGLLFGFKAMVVPGVEFAGIVEKTGSKVKRFVPGDRVFGTTTGGSHGGNAEYVCVSENSKLNAVARLPAEVSFQQGAILPVGFMTAWDLLEKAKLRAGDSLMVYGASGSVGSYAVQLGKIRRARVTAVCGTSNMSWVSVLGADAVWDYSQDLPAVSDRFDVVLDAVGKTSKKRLKDYCSARTRFVSVKSPTAESSMVLEAAAGYAREGQLKGHVEKVLSLMEVPDGHRLVESGRKKGNIVVTVDPQLM